MDTADTKKVEELLATVSEEKHAELLEKLRNAKSEQEGVAIARQYVDAPDSEEPAWLADSYELSQEELEMVAGGTDMPWDHNVDDTNCS